MQKKRVIKQSLIIGVILSITLIVNYLVWRKYQTYLESKKSVLSAESISQELGYAENSRKEIEKNAFLKNLPIQKEEYTIIYSSIKKKFIVIFTRSKSSIDILKSKYNQNILTDLKNIGVEVQDNQILWEVKI